MISPATAAITPSARAESADSFTLSPMLLKTSSWVGCARAVEERRREARSQKAEARRIACIFITSPRLLFRLPRRLVLRLRHLRDAAQDCQGIPPHLQVGVALGQPPDLAQQLPPAYLAQGPQRRHPVLRALVAEHRHELPAGGGDLHRVQRLDGVCALARGGTVAGALREHRDELPVALGL